MSRVWATVAAGIAISGLVGLWWKNTRPKQLLPKETLIKILQAIETKNFFVLTQMAAAVGNLLKKLPSPPTPEDMKEIFEGPESQFPAKFQDVLQSVFQEFNTDQEHFEYAVEKGYINDIEIQYYRKKMAQDYHKAMMGASPQMDVRIPKMIGADQILAMVQTILKQQIRVFREGLKRIKEPVTVQEFRAVSDPLNQAFKKKVFQDNKLPLGKTQPDQMLEFCVRSYLPTNRSFEEKYYQLCQQFELQLSELIDQNITLFKF